MSTAAASSPAWVRTSSLVMAPSRRPRVAANPPLVVAMASKPSEANKAADPMSQALGMRSGVPGVCRARNRSARAVFRWIGHTRKLAGGSLQSAVA